MSTITEEEFENLIGKEPFKNQAAYQQMQMRLLYNISKSLNAMAGIKEPDKPIEVVESEPETVKAPETEPEPGTKPVATSKKKKLRE